MRTTKRSEGSSQALLVRHYIIRVRTLGGSRPTRACHVDRWKLGLFRVGHFQRLSDTPKMGITPSKLGHAAQKGRSPVVRCTCQIFVLRKIKRSWNIYCKQNFIVSKTNIKHVPLRHVSLKQQKTNNTCSENIAKQNKHKAHAAKARAGKENFS